MNRSALRIGITVLTLFTAVVHLIILNIGLIRGTDELGFLSILFILNGLGYLILLSVLLRPPVFLAEYGQWGFHYLFILFIIVTIVAWPIFGDLSDILGIITKVVEALLIVALVLHLRIETAGDEVSVDETSADT